MGYDYNVSGLVASVAAGVLLLLPIVAMFIIIARWRDWYMKRQARKGLFRVPRKYWSVFKPRSKKTSRSLISTPRSERKQELVKMFDIHPQQSASRDATLINRGTPAGAGTYLGSGGFYLDKFEVEEKGQTIELEAEEEPMVVADILPDDHIQGQTTAQRYTAAHALSQTQRETATPDYAITMTRTQTQRESSVPQYTVTSMSQTRRETTVPQYTVTSISQSQRENSVPRYSSSQSHQRNEQYYITHEPDAETGLSTTIVKLDPQSYQQSQPVVENSFRTTQRNDVYHVKATGLGQSTRNQDIFISPNIPSSNAGSRNDDVPVMRASTSQPAGDDVAVMQFPDSDEEAGNIPNNLDTVLY